VDRFAVMRTLVSVAHAPSFSAAAAELNISPSLVSRHVADLESQLGVRLVNRTARSVSLTPDGTQYAEFAERILTEIEDQDAQLTQTKASAEGRLSIISPKWIGLQELGLAIGAFRHEHPGIRVRLQLGGISDRLHDFLDQGFDIAFHARHPADSRVKVRRITDLPFMLAASQDYLALRGTPESPGDLAEHDLLTHTGDPVWHLGEGDDATRLRVQNPAVTANAYSIIEQMIELGCGIGHVPRTLVQHSERVAEVVEVLPDLPPPTRSLYAVHAPGDATPERVKIFLNFITDWFKHSRPA
jgi:DNA-binding transcriptional LysR family regulator